MTASDTTVDKGNRFLITNQNKQPTIINEFNHTANEAAAATDQLHPLPWEIYEVAKHPMEAQVD